MNANLHTRCFYLSVLLWLILLLDVVLACKKPGLIKGRCIHPGHGWGVNSCKRDRSNKKTKGISQDLLDQFELMSQYAAAAYRPANTNSTDTLLSCSDEVCKYNAKGPCPLVEAAKARTAIEFQDTPHFDDHGMAKSSDQ